MSEPRERTVHLSRRALLAGLVSVAGLSVLACGPAPAPPSGAAGPAGSSASASPPPAPTVAAVPTTAATAQPSAVTPTAQATSTAQRSGEILLTPEEEYGVGSGFEAVGKLYQKEYPGVSVKVDVKPQQNYSDWARAQLAGGTKSALMTASFLQDLLAADRFVNLAPYLDQDSPYTKKKWLDSFVAGTFQPDSPTNAIQQMNLMRTNVAWYYNKDLFKKAGLDPDKPPTKWTEMMSMAEQLKKAGIQAFSIEGDYDGFWRMNLGWWRRLFLDSYLRDTVKITRAQAGDFDYRSDVDSKWTYNPNDPNNDSYSQMTNNPNRVLSALLDKKVVIDGEIFRDAYANHMRKMTNYCDPGYFGLSRAQAQQAFIVGGAAMWSDQPIFFAIYEKIVNNPASGIKPFDYGTFPYVTFDDSKLIEAPQRTFVGDLGFWVIPKKDQKQNDLEVDFFQFLTNPPTATQFMLAGLTQTGGDLVGPLQIIGVDLPPVWKQRFEGLKDIGPAGPNAGNYGGALLQEQQAARDYVSLTQSWFSNKMSEDAYFKALQKSFDETVPRLVKAQGLHPEKPELRPNPPK